MNPFLALRPGGSSHTSGHGLCLPQMNPLAGAPLHTHAGPHCLSHYKPHWCDPKPVLWSCLPLYAQE